MNKKVKYVIISFIIVGIVGLIGLFIHGNLKTAPYIKNIEITDSVRFKDQVIFNVMVGNYFYKINKDTWCYITLSDEVPDINDSEWLKANNGYCSFTVPSGNYKIYVKDKYGNINDVNSQKVEINKVIEITPSKKNIYLYKGGKEKIDYELVTIGEVVDDVKMSSGDENIATVSNDGKVIGNNYGMTEITLTSSSGTTTKVNVYVSNFITKPVINFNKPYVKCKQFTKEEADLIDQILFDRVDTAGYGTRAGVIAAARFLALEFSYRIHYFSENGRLNNYPPYKHVDGEGRYYHRGLYLNEDDYAGLEKGATVAGPAMWGCSIPMYVRLPQYTYGKSYPNGLDCSGFVTWALLNGGFDVGDLGAGENAKQYDLDDLGTKVKITSQLLNSNKVKVGDLIGNNGHMAIIAGMDDNNYYIAESLNTTAGVVITTMAKSKLPSSTLYQHIILMDSVYKKDGNYTNMW